MTTRKCVQFLADVNDTYHVSHSAGNRYRGNRRLKTRLEQHLRVPEAFDAEKKFRLVEQYHSTFIAYEGDAVTSSSSSVTSLEKDSGSKFRNFRTKENPPRKRSVKIICSHGKERSEHQRTGKKKITISRSTEPVTRGCQIHKITAQDARVSACKWQDLITDKRTHMDVVLQQMMPYSKVKEPLSFPTY